MENVDSLIEFVKQQGEFQHKMVGKYLGTGYRETLHRTAVKRFQELLVLLEDVKASDEGTNEPQRNYLSPQKTPAARQRVMLTLDDIKDIPADLMAELNLSDTDKQELLIEKIIQEAGGVLSLDKILVELYRRTGVISRRNAVLSRLYRMANRGLIYTLPSKKGLYSTYEMSQADVKRLFGRLADEAEDDSQGSAPITAFGQS